MSMSTPQASLKAAGGTMTLTGTVTGSAGIGTRIQADIQWDASVSAVKYFIIPASEYWLITDVYADNSADTTDANPQVEFYKDQDRVMDRSKPLKTIIITSTQRPPGLNTNIGYQGGSYLTVFFTTTRDANSTAQTARANVTYEKFS